MSSYPEPAKFPISSQKLNTGLNSCVFAIKDAKTTRSGAKSNIQKKIMALDKKQLPKDSKGNLKTVNAIWVDDDPMVTDLQCQLLFPLIIDVYRTPFELMKHIKPNCIYSKNTPIFLDYSFDNAPNITGVDVAKNLYELGFTKLHLLSGQDFEATDVKIPDYLMILPKSAAAHLDKYF